MSMYKTKVLIIQEELSHYNVPCFNILSECYDLTFVYTTKAKNENAKFKTIHETIKTVGPFAFFDNGINNIIKGYDVVICGPYLKYLNILLKTFGKKNVIYYGIGLTASYKNGFDTKKHLTYLLSRYVKSIGAAVFYTQYAKDRYVGLGINPKKLFVANNTVEVLEHEKKDKDILLFVGTLYKEKGVFELIDEYIEAFKINSNIADLFIVGDGDEKESLIKYVNDSLIVRNKIKFLGAIFEEKKLKELFERSIACISPNQAGLTVLKSMGYGVPFITKENAITGGEILNITNGSTGILYKRNVELRKIILDTYLNYSSFLQMGKEAEKYYNDKCTVKNQANGFIEAIEFVKKKC